MDIVRRDWLHYISNHIQKTASLIALGDESVASADAARDFEECLPSPSTPVEDQLLRGLLLELCLRWAALAHTRVHPNAAGTCEFREAACVRSIWEAEHAAEGAKRVFRTWTSSYFNALHRTHPGVVTHAAEWIREHSRERITDRIVARAVGLNVAALRRLFKQTYGIPLRSYVESARLRDALMLLSTGSHDARSALYTVGWNSPKSLYAAALKVTGMSLDRLRELQRNDWERLTALPECTILHQTQPGVRISRN